jgi:hypothetical protein
MAATKKKASAEKVTLVPLTELHERADHPIKMRDDDSMRETIESVKMSGVLTPGIVRPRTEGGYEIIAGRRRKLACEAAGLGVFGLGNHDCRAVCTERRGKGAIVLIMQNSQPSTTLDLYTHAFDENKETTSEKL